MRWRTAQHGDRRRRVVFAFLPRRCDDGTTRWLERLELIEEWKCDPVDMWGDDWWIVSCLPLHGVRSLP